MKQRKATKDGRAVFFDIHKKFLDPDHVARQATDAEGKLQNSHDKYVILHKERHAIIESITDYGYIDIDNGIKLCHFLQGIKSPELEAVVNVVHPQPEKYGTDFDATMSYLG